MKKTLTILLCTFGLLVNAEQVKMALLQPRVAEGSDACRPIELNMVRGELRKAFGWQSDFQVLTRTDVDQMLKELGFQQSGMVDDNQRRKVGEMTGAQYICVSSLTKEGTQLYIEAYLVDVETGQMTNPATKFAKVQDNDYGTLQEPCNALAREMLGELGGGKKRTSGVIPIKSKPIAEGYVDLGLPSGTLWKAENENCGFVNFDQAYNLYGNSLPTKEQLEELKNKCSWIWAGNGYKVKGKNGAEIFLPASGHSSCFGAVKSVGWEGLYCSSEPTDSENTWCLFFHSKQVTIYHFRRCNGSSVRLVK
jgi:TolB-like protein